MTRFWDSLYDKVKAQVKGLVGGGVLVAVLLGLLQGADVTELSGAEYAVYSLAVAILTGLVNAYRKPEEKDPLMPHHTPGEPR